ncbi:hypothetical protein NAC44_20310 [Allorhizobium sp. BGMRC 0089]|uniref:hypothetical protein n=1 Tax=Allorhizobium sonneratiae TaxID=2934936 RepID=UPI0020344B1A|nr:hypothetical protein [Allorhizobium sonneratiae]MCM2294674.1 hypothetical protein [Allorhizobium sonneratiae]
MIIIQGIKAEIGPFATAPSPAICHEFLPPPTAIAPSEFPAFQGFKPALRCGEMAAGAANDATCECLDEEGDVDETLSGRNIRKIDVVAAMLKLLISGDCFWSQGILDAA